MLYKEITEYDKENDIVENIKTDRPNVQLNKNEEPPLAFLRESLLEDEDCLSYL